MGDVGHSDKESVLWSSQFCPSDVTMVLVHQPAEGTVTMSLCRQEGSPARASGFISDGCPRLCLLSADSYPRMQARPHSPFILQRSLVTDAPEIDTLRPER